MNLLFKITLIVSVIMSSNIAQAAKNSRSCTSIFAKQLQNPRRGAFKKNVVVVDFSGKKVPALLIGRIDHDGTPKKMALDIEIVDIKLLVNNTEYFIGNAAMTEMTQKLIVQSVFDNANSVTYTTDNGPAIPAIQPTSNNKRYVTEGSRTYPDGVEYLDHGFRFEATEFNGEQVFQIGKIESFSYQYLFTSIYLNIQR